MSPTHPFCQGSAGAPGNLGFDGNSDKNTLALLQVGADPLFLCLSVSPEICFSLFSSLTCFPRAPRTSAGEEGVSEPLLPQHVDD